MAGGSESVRELVEHLVRSLVDDPDSVEVTRRDGDEETVIAVRVTGEDIGRVIGRQGRVANALRTVARAAAARHGERAIVEIEE